MSTFDREFMLQRRLATSANPSHVFMAVEEKFRSSVGGVVSRVGNKVFTIGGAVNTNLFGVAEIYSEVTLTQNLAGYVDIDCKIRLTPSGLFWVFGIGGFFCLLFLWIGNILYFTIDPRMAYLTALNQINPDVVNPVEPAKPFGY
jgi:hypothetical protein